MLAVLAVFIVTYVLIAGRRLQVFPIGRPAGAMLGAVGMVVIGVFDPTHGLLPEEGLRAVEPNTIALLFGMMILAGSIAEAGFFDRAASLLSDRVRSPIALLWSITLGSGMLSALVLNDAVCLLLTPVVDSVARQRGLPRVPYLLALACGSNAGSAMTLAGNPQNMLVATLSGIPYRTYLLEVGPAALVGLVVTGAALAFVLRREIAHAADAREAIHAAASNGGAAPPADEAAPSTSVAAPSPASTSKEPTSTVAPIVVLVAVSVAFLTGGHLAWTSLAGAVAIISWRRRDASPLFAHVSWTVLVFFGALFVVVAGLQKSGLADAWIRAFTSVMPATGAGASVVLAALLLVGCQIISNVPAILLLEPWVATSVDPQLSWMIIALVTTLAGNLTILGSVANILVIEGANAQHEIGFRRHLKVGAPVTIVSTIAAMAVLLATRAALH